MGFILVREWSTGEIVLDVDGAARFEVLRQSGPEKVSLRHVKDGEHREEVVEGRAGTSSLKTSTHACLHRSDAWSMSVKFCAAAWMWGWTSTHVSSHPAKSSAIARVAGEPGAEIENLAGSGGTAVLARGREPEIFRGVTHGFIVQVVHARHGVHVARRHVRRGFRLEELVQLVLQATVHVDAHLREVWPVGQGGDVGRHRRASVSGRRANCRPRI